MIRKIESENQMADIFTKGLQGQIYGPAPSKRGNLGPVPAPVARGCQGPLNNSTCLIRGLRNPATMTMEQGGEGGRKRTGTGDAKTAGRTTGPSGAGERVVTTKILPR